MTTRATTGRRNIEKNGRNMVVRTYSELQKAIKDYYIRRAWRRKNRGIDVPEGELKGHSHALDRVLCWLATLSDADQERIQEEGERLMGQLHELPEDYDGELPFGRREESVFHGGQPAVVNGLADTHRQA